MTITREQVADLQAGDVVELTDEDWGGTVMRGPLIQDYDGELILGTTSRRQLVRFGVRAADGSPPYGAYRTLTVISRAPRPLYVNHPRTEPIVGDVVRDADDSTSTDNWRYCDKSGSPWVATAPGDDYDWCSRDELPNRLRLLVDGDTGQVVP